MISRDPVLARLRASGVIVRTFDQQDSGCVSHVWRSHAGDLKLIKVAVEARALAGLERAWRIHQDVSHPTLVSPDGRLEAPDGSLQALAFPFVAGDLLYDYTKWTSHGRQHDPASPHVRFRDLDTPEILAAYDAILGAHVEIERAGWVAVDLYDGCLLYDFDARVMRLIDLDEYRPGPFTLDADRLPGSRRFMAPEEFVRGSRIDSRTNVFALGRMASVLLTRHEGVWAHGADLRDVIDRATREDAARRFERVADFVGAWRAALERRERKRGAVP